MEEAPDQDAIALLMADHRRVAKLFAEFDALKADGSEEAKSALVAQICLELTIHTTLEEELFYPAVRKEIEDDDLMDEALVEHAGAKQLIAQLRAADPGDDLYDAKVTVLGEQIDHHVQEEEGSMFPQAKGSGIDTIALGASLLKRKAVLLENAHAPSSRAAGNSPADETRHGASAGAGAPGADALGADPPGDNDSDDEPEDSAPTKPRRVAAPKKTGRRRAANKIASKKKSAKKAR
jgi:hemerythrin superfamily protein